MLLCVAVYKENSITICTPRLCSVDIKTVSIRGGTPLVLFLTFKGIFPIESNAKKAIVNQNNLRRDSSDDR
uniref:Uncharacterized protein n=1 Tax=Anopheles minimus TaxID=112268 RepID=A0A182WQ39_9DIPT